MKRCYQYTSLKAKIKALEGENEQLSDRLGKAILEKERNGTKVFKAENDKEYYRQQMDNARTTSNRLRTENQELKTETKELKKELGKMKDLGKGEFDLTICRPGYRGGFIPLTCFSIESVVFFRLD